jgi:alkanesulfonate monooxygenase SsuD/methylene tetrahydromethanopterin reductase-like flavin-dependent oxidoreductase (luciferase family)
MTTGSTPGLRLGFFTYLDGSTDATEAYRQAIELFVAADELGFDTGWVAQHHFGRHGTLPAPLLFLNSIGQRTSRIDFGTAIVSLPIEVPVRVIEDAAVLETLYPGRLQLGLGTGANDGSAAAFGRAGQDRREAFEKAYDVIRSAALGNPIAGEKGTELFPPAPGLADRLWSGTGSEAGAVHAGSNGAGLLLSRTAWGAASDRTPELQVPLVESYRSAARAAGFEPRVGVSRSVYPAQDRATAQAHLAEGVLAFHQQLAGAGVVAEAGSLDEVFAAHNIHYGHPDEIVKSLSADPTLDGATELIFQVQPGQPGFDATLTALESVARDIAPHLGWTPRTAHTPTHEGAQR